MFCIGEKYIQMLYFIKQHIWLINNRENSYFLKIICPPCAPFVYNRPKTTYKKKKKRSKFPLLKMIKIV